MKVVINKCYGGFGLSFAALERYNELSDNPVEYAWQISRNDPILVQVVEEMGGLVNSYCSELKVVEIPDDVKWYIDDYDGFEKIHEDHRSWG